MDIRWATKRGTFEIEHITTNLMAGRFNKSVKVHRHPVYHLLLILEGRGKITIGGATTAAVPGQLYVIHPNEPHGFLFGDGEPLTNLECTSRLLNEDGTPAEDELFELFDFGPDRAVPDKVRERPLAVPLRFRDFLREGFERLLELDAGPAPKFRYSAGVADLLSRIEAFLAEFAGDGAADDRRRETVELVRRFFRTRLNRGITLKEAADFVHVSPNYLCRLFKECTGESPMAHLTRMRVQEAKKLLDFTHLPVQAVAEKTGFSDASHFSRVFRKMTGESPQSYRKKSREAEPYGGKR